MVVILEVQTGWGTFADVKKFINPIILSFMNLQLM